MQDVRNLIFSYIRKEAGLDAAWSSQGKEKDSGSREPQCLCFVSLRFFGYACFTLLRTYSGT